MTGKVRCVHCRERPVDPAWRPFCSERCQLLDLQNWIDERYRVPGEPVALHDLLDGGEGAGDGRDPD